MKRGNRLPGHVRTDTRLEWRRRSGMRISIGAQDIFKSGHFEFDPESLTVASPVGRNLYGRISWGF